jgi:hypothetical protein
MTIQVHTCPRCLSGALHHNAYYSESTCVQCGAVRYDHRPQAHSGHVRRYPYVGDGPQYLYGGVAIRAHHGQRVILACPRGNCAQPMQPSTPTQYVCARRHVVRLTMKGNVKGWL